MGGSATGQAALGLEALEERLALFLSLSPGRSEQNLGLLLFMIVSLEGLACRLKKRYTALAQLAHTPIHTHTQRILHIQPHIGVKIIKLND